MWRGLEGGAGNTDARGHIRKPLALCAFCFVDSRARGVVIFISGYAIGVAILFH